MDTVRQTLRPKHQVLILRCYPKYLQKNNTEVKANSSELSYLLYYASTRRSKLQKVGDYLEKRTVAQVGKRQIGNIQVTLEIIKALIEKCARDLTLFAGPVLSILRTILSSSDITMIESTVPTFKAFCASQDPATLAADQTYIKQYEEVVQLYAQFASKEIIVQSKTPISWPVAIRFRKVGLDAIKSVASSESLSSETGRQLAVVIPAVLLNIYSESGDYLDLLQAREREAEEHEKEHEIRRRQSQSTVRTVDTAEADPKAASGTTEDADKLAEEEVGIIALQSLRHIFMAVSRGQLRPATSAVLKFIVDRVKPFEHDHSWSTTLLTMICSWAPVQDRYAILITAMEILIQSPLTEPEIENQLILSSVIAHLLHSSFNFIGLSVMDVLIGLLKHILLLLQAEGQWTDSGWSNGTVIVGKPSESYIQLLDQLQRCVAGLATHVYYSDQISDMLIAILARLKPGKPSGSAPTTATIEEPPSAVDSIPTSTVFSDKTTTDSSFSFDMARFVALTAAKDILTVANSPTSGGTSGGRGNVDVFVWENTQWLLRHPDGKIRRAYVEALLSWLNLEVKRADLRVSEDSNALDKKEVARGNSLSRKILSNIPHAERHSRTGKSTFLQLLHLAIYENAHFYADSEADIQLLHLLLSCVIQRLGVNGVRIGLPMIWRLQEDIPLIENPLSKVHIGSLVHGYFWSLSIQFDFETSTLGRVIHSEIARRNEKKLWVSGIQVPPVPISQISPLGANVSEAPPTHVIQQEALKPFDDRAGLVEKIAEGYSMSFQSPPSSPPGSPGRAYSSTVIVNAPTNRREQLPTKIKEQMLADWTKESCFSENSKDGSSAGSMSGSRTGGTGSLPLNLLTANIANGHNIDSGTRTNSPHRSHNPNHRSRPTSGVYGLIGSSAASPLTASSTRSAVRVDDLKRVLSGARRTHTRDRHEHHEAEDTGSESLVSVDFSASEFSFSPTEAEEQNEGSHGNHTHASGNGPSRQPSRRERDAVPPVPPLPPSLRGSNTLSTSPRATSASPDGRPRTAPASAHEKRRPSPKPDFSGLLDAIEVSDDEALEIRGGKPPY